MTMARAHVVDASVTRWYHYVTRCVRRPSSWGRGEFDRKEWIDRRQQELAGIFAVSVGGFSVLDNHLHLLVRLDSEVANGWSDEEVVRRWGRLLPQRDKSRLPVPISNDWVHGRLKDAPWVVKTRARLQSLSWFMKRGFPQAKYNQPSYNLFVKDEDAPPANSTAVTKTVPSFQRSPIVER